MVVNNIISISCIIYTMITSLIQHRSKEKYRWLMKLNLVMVVMLVVVVVLLLLVVLIVHHWI